MSRAFWIAALLGAATLFGVYYYCVEEPYLRLREEFDRRAEELFALLLDTPLGEMEPVITKLVELQREAERSGVKLTLVKEFEESEAVPPGAQQEWPSSPTRTR